MSLAGSVFRQISRISKISSKQQIIPTRNGHTWSYRVSAPPASKRIMYSAEAVGALMWWWILWHLWTEPEHITGEFPYPDPNLWTDAELGIPPDDVE